MSNQKKAKKETWAETLQHKLLVSEEFPEKISLTVIVPVYNCSEVVANTLESLKKQHYPQLEVIVVDAGSTDKTLDIVNSYAALIHRIYTAPKFNYAEMVNRGISLATGDYLTFLFPGSFYISSLTFKTFSQKTETTNRPHVVYCGSIQRESTKRSRKIFSPFEESRLARGEKPATLSACWFRRDLFAEVGKFNPRYKVRFDYDFFCRLTRENKMEMAPIDRFFVDFDALHFSYGRVLRYQTETAQILFHYFGLHATMTWLFSKRRFEKRVPTPSGIKL